ncbi:uncharacterized protein LOC126595886 isoform X3 [Malus sylvestris]|uniref:uncharacterized protein LOC126595886 isoform X3 n=1 Tax=Malus sylvestris TaxID=3752 RepID=UPI0021ACE3D0|nr:uncharacterized protein LOC126595886 isoform X3 [Malus sylvestris]
MCLKVLIYHKLRKQIQNMFNQSSNKSASSGSARLMEYFLDHAKDNTEKGLETCRILGAFLSLRHIFLKVVSYHQWIATLIVHIRL